MSEVLTSTPSNTEAGHQGANRRSRAMRVAVTLVVVALLLVLPLYIDEFWLRTGFAVCAAVIGAIGLNLLVGTTGLLSLGHAFFLAVGAITYVYVAGEEGGTATKISGLGWPPLVAMLLGVLMAGLCGLLFSPIAARLRGIYLGVASLGLVFIGQHVLNTWTSVTGGFNGRVTPEFAIFGFHFASDNPEFMVLDVPYGPAERLWYLGLVLAGATIWFARNLLRSRPGRALQTLRDSEVAAAVMGVNVQGYKARIFLVSSMLGGLSGVLYALSIGAVAPESFSLLLSVQFLAMIVLGGLGSVWGAAVGAAFVSALPLVFQEYADSLPYIAEPGSPGIVASQAAAFLYGLAIVLVVLFEPEGLAGLARKVRNAFRHRLRGTRHPRTPVGQLTTPRGVQPMKTKHPRLVALVVIAMCLFGAGCGTKGSGGEGSSEGGVKTERGVEGNTITLGALTDLTGVFAALGKDITNAQALYWQNQNAGDKVCGKYDVKLEVKDHGYVTQQGVQLYGSIHDDVLAIEQTIGSPINTALAPQIESDKMVNIPAAWAQSLTENPENAIVGATYEIEMINVLDYLLKEGKIKEGDKIGHIYFEGEYGEGGLQGSKYFADKHDMTIVESRDQVDRHGHDRTRHEAQGAGRQRPRAHGGAGTDSVRGRGGGLPGPRRPHRGQQPGLRSGPARRTGRPDPGEEPRSSPPRSRPSTRTPSCSRSTRPSTRATRRWESCSAPLPPP